MPASVQIVYNHLPQLKAALRPAVRTIVQETLFAIETQAKIKCPVDTGALRGSIQSEPTGETSGIVATNVTYAPFTEYGTVKMAARPWMTPAAEGERSNFLRKFKDLESRLE